MIIQNRESFIRHLESLFENTESSIKEFILTIIQSNSSNDIMSHEFVIPEHLITHDIIGELYQRLSSKSDKNRKGQYFTEPVIIEDIVRKSFSTILNSNNEKLRALRICDPACGSGLFLIKIYSYLYSRYTQLGYDNAIIPSLIMSNLYGYDKDPLAVEITKFNLSKISGIPANNISTICENDFLYKDNLSFSQNHLSENKFDLVIGNPPWGSSLSAEEKKYYRNIYFSAKSGINTFTLFIERALEITTEGGFVSFLVPESLLNIDAHRNCRNIIISRTRIIEIKLWGDMFKNVYAPCVSLICRKSELSSVADNIVEFILKNSTASIQQCSFFSTHNNIININFTTKERDIIEQIKQSEHQYLKDNADFFLGIVTGSNEKHLSRNRTENSPDPILIGKDVSPYTINHSGHYFRYNPNELQQVAPLKYYETKNKILYKFIGKRLCFAIDKDGYFTLNNVNGFIPKLDWISNESLIAILNSTLMQYYYDKNFFTVKVLKGNLEKLPIKQLSKDANRILKELSLQMMNCNSNENRKHTLDTIDDIVFSEYDIEDKEAYYIYENYATDKQQLILPGT